MVAIGHVSDRVDRVAVLSRLGESKWLPRVLVWGGLLVVWQIVAVQLGPLLLPTVDAVVVDGFGEVVAEEYYATFLETLRQLVIGFALACAIAIPVGALIGAWRPASLVLSPYITMLYVTPKESLLPLLILIFGVGLGFQVTIVVLFAFFFPLMNTASGVANIDRRLLETARAFRTPRLRIFRHVILPATAPYIVTGLRLGIGMAMNAMIISELWVVAGTGGLLTTLGQYHLLAPYFALASMVAAVAIGLNVSLRKLERRLEPWKA